MPCKALAWRDQTKDYRGRFDHTIITKPRYSFITGDIGLPHWTSTRRLLGQKPSLSILFQISKNSKMYLHRQPISNRNFLKDDIMEKYDLIVIGGGSGVNLSSNAAIDGMKVCLIERSQLGGTCTNNGCLPSKMLTYPAYVIRMLQDAKAVGIKGANIEIDFPMIMGRMRSAVDKRRAEIEEFVRSSENVTLHQDSAEFIDEYTLMVGDTTVTAPNIVIASGSRPLVPPIQGLKETGYLDNISVLKLLKQPQSLIILGGGYIGCEYGHFFSAMGTEVTILGRNPRLLPNEDPEISDMVKKVMLRI